MILIENMAFPKGLKISLRFGTVLFYMNGESNMNTKILTIFKG